MTSFVIKSGLSLTILFYSVIMAAADPGKNAYEIVIPAHIDSFIRTLPLNTEEQMATVDKAVDEFISSSLSSSESFIAGYSAYLKNLKSCRFSSRFLSQFELTIQDIIVKKIENHDYQGAQRLIRLARADSLLSCFARFKINGHIDSVYKTLSVLAKISPKKYKSKQFLLTEFNALVSLCSYGVFEYGEACHPHYDKCLFYADTLEKKYPGSSLAAYARFRIYEVWHNGGGEYGRFYTYEPKDLSSYFTKYPRSVYADSVRYFICNIPIRGHAIDIDEKKAVCSFKNSCSKYLPQIKSPQIRKKLLETQTLLEKQAVEHGVQLICD